MFIIITLVVFIGVTYILGGNLIDSKNQLKSQEDYSPVYRYLSSLTEDEFEDKIHSKDNFIAYIGSSECPDCISFEPTLIRIIETSKIKKKVYFLNLYWMRKENRDEYEKLKINLDFAQIPSFILFEKGRIISKIEWSEKGLSESEIVSWLEMNDAIE